MATKTKAPSGPVTGHCIIDGGKGHRLTFPAGHPKALELFMFGISCLPKKQIEPEWHI